VDQYRPERFIDLLGDERVHREALGWVKEWDVCVFGKRKSGKGGSKASTKRSWDHDSASKATTSDTPEWINKDEWQRPREKILLLSGPPGLGKTTLAHVIAKQAGYRVYEINARCKGRPTWRCLDG
jgi:chromosome transmission fidelity protein 18